MRLFFCRKNNNLLSGRDYSFVIGKIKNNTFLEWIGINKFKKSGKNLKGYQYVDIPTSVINRFMIVSDERKSELLKIINSKCYFTMWRNNRPYMVSINGLGNRAKIYRKSRLDLKAYEFLNDWGDYIYEDWRRFIYDIFVYKFNIKKVYVGKSPKCKTTKMFNTFGNKYDGNTILLKINDDIYILISNNITKIKLECNVRLYVSPVINNRITCPAIIGDKRVYFLRDNKFIHRKYLPKSLTYEECFDIYLYYFRGNNGVECLERFVESFDSFKILK